MSPSGAVSFRAIIAEWDVFDFESLERTTETILAQAGDSIVLLNAKEEARAQLISIPLRFSSFKSCLDALVATVRLCCSFSVFA